VKVNEFAALSVTYAVAALCSFVLSCLSNNFSKEALLQYKNISWASLLLGVVIIGLEYGYIQAYRVGWGISVCSLVANISLAIVLVFVGILLYKEHMSINQFAGILLCIFGLYFISKK